MKYSALSTLIFALILPSADPAAAGPLQKKQIAADAKWLLHLDMDKLRSTSAGDYVITEIADKVLAEPKAAMKREADFDLDLTKISSLTAYGDFSGSNNVLLVKTTLDVEKALDGVIARVSREGKSESSDVAKTVQDGIIAYQLRDHAVVWIRPDKTVILSKSSDANRRADDVLSGKAPNLSSSHGFPALPEPQKSAFFLGAAEGFNTSRELTSEAGEEGNPKARMLKLTESGQAALGQEGDQLVLTVSLKARSAEVVKQMQQVVQGMIALAALMHGTDEDIQQLTDSAKVSTAGDVVSINLSYPADKALALFDKHLPHQDSEHAHHKAKEVPPAAEEK